MAAPKVARTLAGQSLKPEQVATGDPVTKIPPDIATLEAQILQLQNSFNELVVRYNAHVHATATTPTVSLVTGTAQTAANLFTSA